MFDLVRWSPFTPFTNSFQLHREIDELLGRVFGERQARSATPQTHDGTPTWWPAVESGASDGHLFLRVARPGVEPKDVELSVADNVLAIKGQRRHQAEVKEPSYFLREFERSLVLPEGVDPAGVTAKYANGMLEITMPLPLAVGPKKVDIQIDGQSGTQKTVKAA